MVGCFEDIIKVEDLFLFFFGVEFGLLVFGIVLLGVKGRFKVYVLFWEKIGVLFFIIDCIREGYKILFYVFLFLVEFSNNCFGLEYFEFVYLVIFELFFLGRVC